MTSGPQTIPDCDRALTDICDRYKAAVDRDDLASAADLWEQLHALLDIRLTLHQQRQP